MFQKYKSTIIVVLCTVIILAGVFVVSELSGGKKEVIDLLKDKYYAVINIKDYGEIEVELDAENTPITVTNFVNLVNSGFYNGLTFHRVIENFMIQGGDPLGTGMGGSDVKIQGEFSNNGVSNSISHIRGTISMARSGNSYNSASSQFFIVHKDSVSLDGDYAAFGKVIKGMDVVDKIAEGVPVVDNNGTVLKGDQPIITSIKINKSNE